MKEISIHVCGRPKTGKSTVIKIIEDALNEAGFQVSVQDPDKELQPRSYYDASEAKIAYVSRNSRITIQQVFTNRDGIVNFARD